MRRRWALRRAGRVRLLTPNPLIGAKRRIARFAPRCQAQCNQAWSKSDHVPEHEGRCAAIGRGKGERCELKRIYGRQ